MENFVTLFDSAFAPQGLALYNSMRRHISDFRLWVICLDDDVFEWLSKLNLPLMSLLRLSDIETDELRRVKNQRSRAEYCWTLTPFAASSVFSRQEDIDRVTYLDADLWFLRAPKIIFDEFELSGKKVLITKHAFHPYSDSSDERGIFCVQFIILTRKSVETVQKWWQEKCIEWCYARLEKGRFGDQMYLDSWPDLFGNEVHVLENEGAALGPWNALRFPWSDGVFFHFHGLRVLGRNWASLSNNGYCLPHSLIISVYKPYLNDLNLAFNEIEKCGGTIKTQLNLVSIEGLKILLRGLRRYMLKVAMYLPRFKKIGN